MYSKSHADDLISCRTRVVTIWAVSVQNLSPSITSRELLMVAPVLDILTIAMFAAHNNLCTESFIKLKSIIFINLTISLRAGAMSIEARAAET